MPFLSLINIIKANKALNHIYQETGEMNRECKRIFLRAFDALVKADTIPLAELADEDKIINKYEVSIREKILTYLAFTSTPSLNSTMILTNTVISYERIGDYSKGIASLGVNFPVKFDQESEYFRIVTLIKETIVKQFDLTYEGFSESDAEKAKQVIESYRGIKSLHEALIARLSHHKEIETNTAIVYACLCIFMRRIGAHLKNICTAVLYPPPKFGFANKKDIE
ncbi:MAG TPA: hypothetical protein EYP29_02840 [Thermoplasmata archaeon]|nr:hypothetical protein [Thermoplasmata archaeon]